MGYDRATVRSPNPRKGEGYRGMGYNGATVRSPTLESARLIKVWATRGRGMSKFRLRYAGDTSPNPLKGDVFWSDGQRYGNVVLLNPRMSDDVGATMGRGQGNVCELFFCMINDHNRCPFLDSPTNKRCPCLKCSLGYTSLATSQCMYPRAGDTLRLICCD